MDAIKTVQEQPHAAGSERKGTVLPGALGGIIGDVCGSIYERRSRTTDNPEEIDLYNPNCRFTDDTVLTVATMEALLTDRDYAKAYRPRRIASGVAATQMPVMVNCSSSGCALTR